MNLGMFGIPGGSSPPQAGSMVLLSTINLSATVSLISFANSFSAIYDDYILIADNVTTGGANRITVNLAVGGNSLSTGYFIPTYPTTPSSYIDTAMASNSYFSIGEFGNGTFLSGNFSFKIQNANGNGAKTIDGMSTYMQSTGTFYNEFILGINTTTSPISGIIISGYNIAPGATFKLYGIKKS